MKNVLLSLLIGYQAVVSPILRNVLGVQVTCRYSPTCSEYMKQMVQKYGVIKGFKKGLTQLSACHPWSNKYGTNI